MTLGTGLDILLFLLGSPLHFAAAYLLFATLLSAPLPRPVVAQPTRRFRFVVPAHNESAGITETVKSLLAVDYPSELFEVVVIAVPAARPSVRIGGKLAARRGAVNRASPTRRS